MIALCFLACLALASAAPHHEFRPFMRRPPAFPHHRHHDHSGEELATYFSRDLFDAERFWEEKMREIQEIDQVLTSFFDHFPSVSSQNGVQGNEYVITMTLNGFEEKDIKVKAREGVLMVQAIHSTDEGNQRSYLDIKTLPSYVNVNGTWTYDMGVLKITFPLNSRPGVEVTETAIVDVDLSTTTERRDREEMDENQSQDVQDVDVGLGRGDRDRDTNMIPTESTAEFTTYAVDLSNEVEFVPVKF